MDRLASVWTWVAQFPLTVVAVCLGLVLIAGALAWRLRRGRGAELLDQRAEKERAEPERRAKRAKPAAAPAPGGGSFGGLSEDWRAPAEERAPPPSPPAAAMPQRPASMARPSLQSASEPADATTAGAALEIEAGRLVYQIPAGMWLGIQETVEVRLGQQLAAEIMEGFSGRGDIRSEDIPIVETMSVSLMCAPGAFDIESRSQEVQLVNPALVKGTAFHQDDFGKWVWLVTPRQRGAQKLSVKVSAAIKDSRGVPTTSSLPDKVISVDVRVHLGHAATGTARYLAPRFISAVATALVGVLTKDYWWPYVRDVAWPAVRALTGNP
jgi:hypothetical protein